MTDEANDLRNHATRIADAEAECRRLRVALRKGLTETQAKRLVGDDEDALEQDADDLLASFKTEHSNALRRPRDNKPAGFEPELGDLSPNAEMILAFGLNATNHA